ncbi:M16 family metallopeptidase [Catenulispora rubra]|uniref:M16 family metallopeptidase n=1 Tax=Catenulispora rubra TaxID=280293 RepID=UPI001892180E|nr:insulinase family protein [Catenulispora rubra]
MIRDNPTPTYLFDLGVSGIAVDMPGCPMFYLGYGTRPGLLAEGPGKDGVSSLLYRLITDRMMAAMDGLGIPEGALSGFAGPDSAGIQARVLPQQVVPAVRIIADQVRTADYDDAEFQMSRRDYLQDVVSEEFVVGRRARQSLLAQLYGGRGRLARPWNGTYETVAELTLSDVVRCHTAGRRRGRMVLVGDLGEARVLQHVPELLKDLCPVDREESFAPSPEQAVVSPEYGIEVIDRPNSGMVKVCVAAVAPAAGDDDSLVAELLAAAVGGSPSSPLNRVLRDQEGVAYSPSVTYESGARHGFFLIDALVPKEKTRIALTSIFRMLTELADEGVTAARLGVLKASYAATWPALHQTPWAVGEWLLTGFHGERSRDPLGDKVRQIADLDLDRVNSVARRMFGVEGVAVALEGARDEIERQLAS